MGWVAMIVASNAKVLILSRDRPPRDMPVIQLSGLNPSAAMELLQTSGVALAPKALRAMVKWTEGNPLFLQLLASGLRSGQLNWPALAGGGLPPAPARWWTFWRRRHPALSRAGRSAGMRSCGWRAPFSSARPATWSGHVWSRWRLRSFRPTGSSPSSSPARFISAGFIDRNNEHDVTLLELDGGPEGDSALRGPVFSGRQSRAGARRWKNRRAGFFAKGGKSLVQFNGDPSETCCRRADCLEWSLCRAHRLN